jgi:hypothetical protein
VPHTAVGAARLDCLAIGRQIIEARAKIRIDVFFQHIGARVDMRIGVEDPEAVLHDSPAG